ncbi:MAG: FAD-dependent oxidoreductase, partial [Clostridium sp.]|nr:FAD-dependent oxidoreductase [Clostridium sp.]
MRKKITIIGAGPGGYVAALKGAILGAEVTLVERDRLGGTCLNRGCIPTKAFLKSAEIYEEAQIAGSFGVSCGDVNADYVAIKNRKDGVVNQLVGGIKFLLMKKNVNIVQGVGKLMPGKKVEITKADGTVKIIESDAVILANGSIPVIPAMFNYDGDRIITSDELLRLKELPKSMIIVGGGVIGCEFGQFYRKLGTEVTIVEMAEHILPNEDVDVASVISNRMKMQGVKFYTGIGVTKVEKKDGLVTATIATGEELSAEYMLLSIGRKANIEGIVVETVDIMMEKGKVVVNDKMET